MNVSLALAFAAGLLSFASPCVLALVPVYLAFLGEGAGAVRISGAGTASVTGAWRGPLVGEAVLFVIGFSIVFVALGVSVGLLGLALLNVYDLHTAAGIAVIIIGLLTTGLFGPIMDRVWRIRVRTDALPVARTSRAVALGALVGIGWSPCIGPVLGAILTMGASAQDAWLATLLLVAYSAGLALPFLAAAVALPRVRPLFDLLRRHHRALQVISGVFIMAVGVLILADAFSRMAGLFTLI
jgi:cytochrome c-type biogenesis protein